jgi:hypothetical protein
MYHNISNFSTEYISQLSDALNMGQFEPNCLLFKTAILYFRGLQTYKNTKTVDKMNDYLEAERHLSHGQGLPVIF